MAVDVATERFESIVQVHSAEVFEADNTIQLGKGLCTRLGATQVVTRSKAVAGIDAVTHAALVLYPVDNVCNMLPRKAKV